MAYKAQTKAISRVCEFEIGIDESIVVLLERQERTGYLIAEEYARGELPSQITLKNALSFSVGEDDFETDLVQEVLISCPSEIWTAVDVDTIELIPCPALQAYPVLFISSHGFKWMFHKVYYDDCEPLAKHLEERFHSVDFTTDRRTLQQRTSELFGASLRQAKRKIQRRHGSV